MKKDWCKIIRDEKANADYLVVADRDLLVVQFRTSDGAMNAIQILPRKEGQSMTENFNEVDLKRLDELAVEVSQEATNYKTFKNFAELVVDCEIQIELMNAQQNKDRPGMNIVN